jgi:hypothetical protein
MPIEFRCSQCGKLLRTGDDTVGRQAQCPECGAISTVPSAPAPSPSPTQPTPPLGAGSPFGAGQTAGEGSENPYQSPAAASYLPPGQLDALSLQKVSGPATALLVTAILAMILHVVLMGLGFLQVGMGPRMQLGRADVLPMMIGGGVNIVERIFHLILATVILFGALKMKKLESFGFAMAAAIIAMVPCISPCCLLGLPFGIWALTVLNDPAVKGSFRS